MRQAPSLNKNSLFYIPLCLYIIFTLVNASLLEDLMSSIIKYAWLSIIVLLLAFRAIKYEQFNRKKFFYWAGTIIVSLIPLMHGYYTPVIIGFMSLSCTDVPFKKVMRLILITMIVTTMIIVLSSQLGIIRNLVYSHNQSGKISLVYAYGFRYYSTLAYVLMASILLFMSLKNRICSWIEIFLVLIVNFFFYRIHTNVLAYLCVLMFVALYAVYFKLYIIKRTGKSKQSLVVARIMPWILFITTVIFVIIYRKTGLNDANDIFGGNQLIARLRYSSYALDTYGIKLFGSHVVVYGMSSFVYGNSQTAFYIDSGYWHSIIVYGVVFSIGLLIVYTKIMRYLCIQRDRVLYIHLMVFLIISVVNNFLLNVAFNPMILLWGNVVTKLSSVETSDDSNSMCSNVLRQQSGSNSICD